MAAAAPDTIKWFQLYIYKDRSVTEKLIRRAEAAGFKALVLTVDVPTFGIRRADIRNHFQLPSHLQFGNFTGNQSQTYRDEKGSGINAYAQSLFDETLTWKDLKWLIEFTKLPVIVKGVLAEEDAVIAADLGCSGVIVSNHGARQLDSVQASVSILCFIKLF